MIIDPQQLVQVEMATRYRVAAQAAFAIRHRSPRRRRGVALRLVSLAVGRTAHV